MTALTQRRKLATPGGFIRSFSRHTTLIILVIWRVLPFTWAIQSSIKFTRDVAAKKPVLWDYETTSSAYNSFWLDDDEINMYAVLGFILAFAAAAFLVASMGRRVSKGHRFYLGFVDFAKAVAVLAAVVAVLVAWSVLSLWSLWSLMSIWLLWLLLWLLSFWFT